MAPACEPAIVFVVGVCWMNSTPLDSVFVVTEYYPDFCVIAVCDSLEKAKLIGDGLIVDIAKWPINGKKHVYVPVETHYE